MSTHSAEERVRLSLPSYLNGKTFAFCCLCSSSAEKRKTIAKKEKDEKMFSVLDDRTFSRKPLVSKKCKKLKCYTVQRLIVKVNVNLPVLYHSNLRDGSGSNPSH